jgi:SAM-dependent methyltransferase
MITQAAEVIRSISRACGTVEVPPYHSVVFRDLGGGVGQRDIATHWIHWYPAKMFYRIPQAILGALDLPPGSIVLDPFCGSGTVLLEAALLRYRTIGIDVNPLARLISKTKVMPIDPLRLERHARRVLADAKRSRILPRPNRILDFWFNRDSRSAITRLFYVIDALPASPSRNFLLVTLSSILRKVSLADPAIAPPVKLSHKRAAMAGARYRRDLKNAQSVTRDSVFELFFKALYANIRRVADLRSKGIAHRVRIMPEGLHAAKTGLADESVDVILTSPPYCGAQKYVRSLRLEMLSLGMHEDSIIEADRRTLGTERITLADCLDLATSNSIADSLISSIYVVNPSRAAMLALYVRYLTEFAKECRRVIRPGGAVFVTFGTGHIAGTQVPTDEIFIGEAQKAGLRQVSTLVDAIPSRGLLTRRHHTAGLIADERVVWLKG